MKTISADVVLLICLLALPDRRQPGGIDRERKGCEARTAT